MTINDFPVSLALDTGRTTQVIDCFVHLVGADALRFDTVRQTVGSFRDACNLGMLSGARIPPELAGIEVTETASDQGLRFELSMSNIPVASYRVLVAALRSRVLLDGFVGAVEIASRSSAGGPSSLSSTSEEVLRLPGLYDRLSFRYTQEPSMRVTDRGLRVTCAEPLSELATLRLPGIQTIWERICDGGCCPDGVHPVECTMVSEPGMVVAPRLFEVKIGVFNNPEICFDYFVNAIERFSKTVQRVESVETW